VEIPALTQAEVQVSVTLSDLKVEAGDWVLEPATLKDGVISAQTHVDAADFRSLVRVINVTHRPFIIRKDNSLGEAHHAEVCASLPKVDMLSEAQRSLGEDQGHVRTAGPAKGQIVHQKYRNICSV